MATNANRFSTYTTASTGSDAKDGDKKKDMWSSMLASVASGKRLPEKSMLVLGGTVDSQRDFLESLSTNDSRRNADRQGAKLPPVANNFALGYTYYDVLDADQEDILARISLYLMSDPSPSFASLLQPLLTPESIPNTLIVILLDWSQPWLWMRQLREWILLLRTVLVSLSTETKEAMEEVMLGWRDRGRVGGTNLDGTGAAVAEGDAALPLGPGEWEDGLGLPLCVVAQNAEKIELLEKTQGWKEEEFDMVLQYMRTILLKHGASLIYTTPNLPSQLQTLVHSSLGITSLLKREPLKHNTIDRDKILVPPNWDSWGKIRVLREGFDVESVSSGWSIDLDRPFPAPQANGTDDSEAEATAPATANGNKEIEAEGSAVALYEQSIHDPSKDALALAGGQTHSTTLEVEALDTQAFLGAQSKILDQHKKKDEEARQANPAPKLLVARDPDGPTGGVQQQIGPVQFNVGGIQVDADDMLERIKSRQAYGSSPEPDGAEPEFPHEEPTAKPKNIDTENLQAFFSGLMNRRPAKAGPGAS